MEDLTPLSLRRIPVGLTTARGGWVGPVVGLVLLACATPLDAQPGNGSALDRIRARGHVLVGTTGDYRPFSYRRPDGELEGHDIDAARGLAAALGVEIRFVPTTWRELLDGLEAGRYDIAMGGITRTLARATRAGISHPYRAIGKSPLVRRQDRDRFPTLAAIDQPGVRVGVNPGGTNEAFVRSRLSQASIVTIEQNLSIPDAIARGEVDVMITDNIEAVLVAARRPELFAVAPDAPFTREDLGYLVGRDDQAFLNWINLWLHQMAATGELERLAARWLR